MIAIVLHSVSQLLRVLLVSVFLSTFLYTVRFSSLPYLLSYVDVSWTLAGVLCYTSPFSFVLFFTPAFHRAQAPSKLLLSFWWRDSALCTLVWSFLFVLYFSLLLGAPIAASCSQFLTIERFPRATQQISRKKYLGMISIIAPKWRCMETICWYYRFPRFPLSHYSATFHFSLYRYTYQLGRFESRLSVIHFRYLSKPRDLYGEL